MCSVRTKYPLVSFDFLLLLFGLVWFACYCCCRLCVLFRLKKKGLTNEKERTKKKKYPKATTITTMSVAFGSIRNVHAIDTDRETIGVVGVAVSYILCA